MTRQGHKPGDVEVPLLPDVEPWVTPAHDPIRHAEMVHQSLSMRQISKAQAHRILNLRDVHVEPRGRVPWRHRFIAWWCGHASDFARGLE